jgi:hypothetical protein
MTMHLCGPALSMTGKKKGKTKFRNAEEARKARELDASWKELLKRQGIEEQERKRKRAMAAEPLSYKLSAPVGRETRQIQSLDTGHKGAVSSKDIPQYTGTEMLGITIVHKSGLQPVFNQDAAKDAASMRR